jgi:anti-anti-sigma regulatory factor
VLELKSEEIGKATAVRMTGRIDAESAQQLQDACEALIAEGEKVLILDFTNGGCAAFCWWVKS